MANALVSIQILPSTPGGESVLPYVDRAIEIIKESGFPYRVAPLETTMEGELQGLLAVVARMSEAMAEMGCASVISQVKIYYNPVHGASMDRLLEKYPDGK
ncbi:MTH1187 family thiamine-binding protein [Paenibacillus pasadenensis]|uniref:thiamine-binding protein n=1 Tax=Paenibacillus pasadenensis TaxID=217090 RepID=UPI00203B20EA|nr:MTH1187 family thiamine-binding protein [Paenibacillus pasadenensis]MCM3746080.1 MTH1187 family thiamine-binding protein [Paenibacillus pasadenensis]